MNFLQAFFDAVLDFFTSLFGGSSPEYKRKQQLKHLSASLKSRPTQIYQQDGTLLPTFAATLYQIFQFLKPIKEIFDATVSNQDRRVVERYHDALLELAFTEEQHQMRKKFVFSERVAEISNRKMPTERIIEEQGKEFTQFLKVLDTSTMHQASILLEKLDTIVDFCHFDINGFLASFDSAFQTHAGQDTTVESPSFHSVEVAEVIPPLLDFYYLLSRISLIPSLADVIAILEARKNKIPLSDEIKGRFHRIFQAVNWLIEQRVNKEDVLSIIRLTKKDPDFMPEKPKIENNYVRDYKSRLTENFQSDSRKMLQEQQNNEIQGLITATFGSTTLETLEGYTESTDTLLQEFTPFSLEWIKPLEIIKTFAINYFEPHFTQILRSIIVEGYFNNRNMQTSLSSAYYFCETVSAKLAEFELLFTKDHPCSIEVLTGYLTGMEKGMDFEKPLRKIVENMNNHAKKFVQDSVNQYAEMYNFCTIIQEEHKKSVPEYITNIRTLTASTKNTESFSFLEKEITVFRNFLEIMKKYAIVGALSVPVGLPEHTEN